MEEQLTMNQLHELLISASNFLPQLLALIAQIL